MLKVSGYQEQSSADSGRRVIANVEHWISGINMLQVYLFLKREAMILKFHTYESVFVI